MKKHFLLALKCIFILSALSFILWKADTVKIFEYIKSTNPFYLFLAYLMMTLAQVASAFRMRFYYAREGLQLNRKFSIGLYLTSMLFNIVLPGGIGGDGYKIFSIGRLASFSRLKALRIALSERGNGLFVLLLLTALFYIFTDFSDVVPHQNYIIACLTILLLPAYFISVKMLLKEEPLTAIGATLYSLPVQLLNVLALGILLIDLDVDVHNTGVFMGYILIFMFSSVASIIPVTIGGIGIRELTFLYGAKLTGLNSELGIAVAFLFFIVCFLCSLNGFLFWHRLDRIYGK